MFLTNLTLYLLGPSSEGRCGLPETFGAPNIHLADKYISKMSFTSGERVHYVCDVGYVHAGGSRYRKCGDGEWTRLLMKCESKMLYNPLV